MSSKDKMTVGVNETCNGIEIKEGLVGVDLDIVNENISVEVNKKTWFKFNCKNLWNCCCKICKKNECENEKPTETVITEPPHCETITERK